ncbi:MAG: succinylglutamate desuccinylase/aspartoacylase family protein [Alphaproteobacteria bacterium]
MITPHFTIELSAPDILPYKKGNTGVDYVTTFDSGRPGPHVMVMAIVHGNELCGAFALDYLFKAAIRPICGRLTLAFANVHAYLSFNPNDPVASRFIDEDFNRLWDLSTLKGLRTSIELQRARMLWPIIDTVDLLLDIHSMQYGPAPLMLAGPLNKGCAFAQKIGIPSIIVSDKGHAAGRRLRDYGDFSHANSSKNALLVECGQHWEQTSAELAIEVSWRFLASTGVIPREIALPHFSDRWCAPQRLLEVTQTVTISSSNFRFTDDFHGMEVFPNAGTVIAYDGDQPILTPYNDCVLVMPSRHLVPGTSAARLGRYTSLASSV